MDDLYKWHTVRTNIHTLEIKTDSQLNATQILKQYADTDPETAARVNSCINTKASRMNANAEKIGRTFILNLNKWDGDNLFLHSEFMEKLRIMEKVLGIGGKYSVVRCDLKFDSADLEFYERNKKLVRLMLMAIAYGKKVRNVWRAEDGVTLEQRSFKINASSFDIEYYDKRIESEGTDPSKARLEMRFTGDMEPERLEDSLEARMMDLYMHTGAEQTDENAWCIDVSPILTQCNEVLLREWNTGKYRNLHGFVDQKNLQEVLFTRGQLAMLISRIARESDGAVKVTDTQKWIDNHNARYGKIEFVRAETVNAFWECLMDAQTRYFSN